MMVFGMNAIDDDVNGDKKWKIMPTSESDTYTIQDVSDYNEMGTEFGALEYNMLMAASMGFTSSETVFSDDGNTITETDINGRQKITVVNGTSSVTETLYDTDGAKIATKVTTFSMDKKTIKEEVTFA